MTEVDAVPALAEAFPLRVFPDAVGLPDEGRENLLPYGDTAFNAFGPDNALRAKGAPRVLELSGWVAEQCARDVLTDDGSGAAIWAASDRGDITPAQAPLVVRSLLTAGVGTTVHGIGALRACLARTPAAWARLRADPTLVRLAFDEAVRLESPVQMFFRTAERDVAVGGYVVPEGEKVLSASPPRTATPAAGSTRTPSTSTATRRGTSASAWACTSASASTWPGSRPRPW